MSVALFEYINDQDFQKNKTHVKQWTPLIQHCAARHQLSVSSKVMAGFNGTYPVFICGDWVIKFYGFRSQARPCFEHECLVYQCLAQDPRILAPTVLAHGIVDPDLAKDWCYLITARVPGESMRHAQLSAAQKENVIAALGEQLYYLHACQAMPGLHSDDNWGTLDLVAAAKHSSLPPHLIEQIDDFVAALQPFDRVLVHGDMVDMHVFVDQGQLSGIIDWGDAVITDRHYEIAKLCLSIFPCEQHLLQVLLQQAEWPFATHFASQALGMALYRQAVGLTQHHTFDVFWQLPVDWQRFATLKALAEQLFAQ